MQQNRDRYFKLADELLALTKDMNIPEDIREKVKHDHNALMTSVGSIVSPKQMTTVKENIKTTEDALNTKFYTVLDQLVGIYNDKKIPKEYRYSAMDKRNALAMTMGKNPTGKDLTTVD